MPFTDFKPNVNKSIPWSLSDGASNPIGPHAENSLLYELKMSDVMVTSDGLPLESHCNSGYSTEWGKKMAEMVGVVNEAIIEGLCEVDMALVTTYTDVFASMDSEVGMFR